MTANPRITPTARLLPPRRQETSSERIIKSNIYLMKNIQTDAVLIECGFLTNREECKKLSEKEYQKQLSFSIVCGIIEYINETRLN